MPLPLLSIPDKFLSSSLSLPSSLNNTDSLPVHASLILPDQWYIFSIPTCHILSKLPHRSHLSLLSVSFSSFLHLSSFFFPSSLSYPVFCHSLFHFLALCPYPTSPFVPYSSVLWIRSRRMTKEVKTRDYCVNLWEDEGEECRLKVWCHLRRSHFPGALRGWTA